MYVDSAKEQQLAKTDTGIDLIAKTRGTGEYHTIQCKLYAQDYKLRKDDKDSGIVNDANDWAIETMNNPRYPLELFQRVITVSLETMKIVKALPKLDI